MYDPHKDFDQMIPGQRTYAIFGFCDIRRFTDSTECLMEEVMIFVNTIASIVHGNVDKYGGAPNKNIGDAFLLVWKLIVLKENTTLSFDNTAEIESLLIKQI